MKMERLIAIIMLLLERDSIATSELAEKLEVSRRTIFRDIDTLCIAGMPIMVTRGAMGGVSLMNSYKVDKKLFTPRDVQSLITGLQSYNQLLENKELSGILVKLQSLTKEDNSLKHPSKEGRISIDLELSEGNKSLRTVLQVIESAMSNYRYLLFHYTDKKGDESIRKVEPYQVVFKESKWYLQAFCTHRNSERIFKLSRMSKVMLSEESFHPRNFTPLSMNETEWMNKEIIPLIIRIHKSLIERVIERFGEKYIADRQGDYYLARFPIADNEEGYNILLSFGGKCEIIEPVQIRQKFRKHLMDIIKIYDDQEEPK